MSREEELKLIMEVVNEVFPSSWSSNYDINGNFEAGFSGKMIADKILSEFEDDVSNQ